MVILFEACSSLSSQQLNILQNEGLIIVLIFKRPLREELFLRPLRPYPPPPNLMAV